MARTRLQQIQEMLQLKEAPVPETPEFRIPTLKEIPAPSDNLNQIAKAYWSFICKLLIDEDRLTRSWLPLIEQTAQIYGSIQRLVSHINAFGETILNQRSGSFYKNPSCTQLEKLQPTFLSHLRELKLTPKAADVGKSAVSRKKQERPQLPPAPLTRNDYVKDPPLN